MIKHETRFSSWLPAGYDGKFDWDFLLPAWAGTKIEPMDLDAVVERGGHFLIFETKLPGKDVPLGQSLTLTRMWRGSHSTIIQIAGKSPRDICGYALYAETEKDKSDAVGSRPIMECGVDAVVNRCRSWFIWACKNKVK